MYLSKPKGPAGANGNPGTNGQGLPIGGTSGQIISKIDITDFNTQWINPPTGGPALGIGSIGFGNGTTIIEDNANFFWDNTNKRLGIGTNTPNNKLHIPGLINFNDTLFNISLGSGGQSFTTGNRNTVIGRRALELNTTGINNIAIGDLAMNKFIGSSGFAIGALTLLNDISVGTSNMAIGTQSLSFNTTGQGNMGVGNNTLNRNTIGQFNVAMGVSSLTFNTTGNSNVGIGQSSLLNNITGGNNTAIGSGALFSNISGVSNVGLGVNTLRSNTTGQSNIAVGGNALYLNNGINNIGFGSNSMRFNTTGGSNIGLGTKALYNNTTGFNNFGLGVSSLLLNTTGINNVAIGVNSLGKSLTWSNNTAIGSNAGRNANGSSSTYIGSYAGFNTLIGHNNTYIGSNAGRGNINGQLNIFIGSSSGYNELGSNKLYISNTSTSTPLIHGDFTNNNLGFSTTDYAGGVGVQAITNATTIPTLTPTGGGVYYSSGGALYWKGSAGTVTMIAPA